jgi:hypothetical protein
MLREFLESDGLAKVAANCEDLALKDLVRPTLHFGLVLFVGLLCSVSSGRKGTAFGHHVDLGQTDSLSAQIKGLKGWVGVKAKDEAALKKLVVDEQYVFICNFFGLRLNRMDKFKLMKCPNKFTHTCVLFMPEDLKVLGFEPVKV